MSSRINQVIAEGRVAVITGAASGIGATLARALAGRGMSVVLFDRDRQGLDRLVGELKGKAIAVAGDVSQREHLKLLYDQTVAQFGDVALLVNNAAIAERAGPWGTADSWRRIIDVNFLSAVATQELFVPLMLRSNLPAAVVNLGSKEGITTPPGNAAYSVAKAGMKVLTEQLAHELRNASEGRVSAHLLVPGYTWTPMNFPGMDATRDTKPAAPWSAEQLVSYFLERLAAEDFYIICPDNEVTSAIDAKRIRWAAEDMVQNRPALSRWHPEWRDAFANWLKS